MKFSLLASATLLALTQKREKIRLRTIQLKFKKYKIYSFVFRILLSVYLIRCK